MGILKKGEKLVFNTNWKSKMNNEMLKKILEWSCCVIVAVIFALLIRYYLVSPTSVKQSSMYPTLKEGQKILLDRTNRILNKKYERGEIVTFEAPNIHVKPDIPIAIYSYEPKNILEELMYNVLELNKESYIKRIIGIEGDSIRIVDGKVYLNGEKINEQYLKDDMKTIQVNFSNVVVPKGYVFVMGDNRSSSIDSRTFGCIPVEKIEGKVWLKYWPLRELGKIE